MRKFILMLALGALVAAPAAHAMSVAEFLAKAKALKARGILAIGSPDIQLLKDEMRGIADAYRADIVAARSAGRKPHSCPPPKGKAKMDGKELIAELEKIPAAQRNMSMKTAFYGIMARKYPCK